MTISTLIAPAPTEQWKVKRPKPVEYPDSDGKPMADNTKQFRYIVTIKEGLDDLFRADPNVFVAGDLLWYPQEGQPHIRQAPDAMVAFGRPKGDRGSYQQWKEEGIAPQVAFEVLSPGNTSPEMERKRLFYEQYGVDEYYVYDPDRGRLTGWLRRGGRFEEIKPMQHWVSPRLGVRFELVGLELNLYQPDGAPVLSYAHLSEERRQEAQARQQAEAQTLAEVHARQQAEVAQHEAEQLAQSETEARHQAEQLAQSEAEARRQAEQLAQSETEARQQAEAQAQAEVQARQQAEARIAELEAKLRQLTGAA